MALKQYLFISSQFCRSEVWTQYYWSPWLRSHRLKIKMSSSHILSRILQSSFSLMAQISSLWLSESGPYCIAYCEMDITFISESSHALSFFKTSNVTSSDPSLHHPLILTSVGKAFLILRTWGYTEHPQPPANNPGSSPHFKSLS